MCMSAFVVDVEPDIGPDIRSMTERGWRMAQSQYQDHAIMENGNL